MSDITHVIIREVLYAFPLCAMFDLAFSDKMKYSKIKNTAIFFLYGVLAVEMQVLLEQILPNKNALLISLFTCIAFVFLLSLLTSASIKKVVFVVFLLANTLDNIKSISMLISTFVLKDTTYVPVYVYYFSYILVTLVVMTSMYFMFKYVLMPLIQISKGFVFWNYLWLIPTSFYIIYQIAILPKYQVITSSSLITVNDFLIPIAWFGCTFMSHWIIIQSVSKTIDEIQLKESLHVAAAQLDMQAEMYNKIRSNIDEARRDRHDLRHHLIAMESYISRTDYGGAQSYIEQLIGTLGKESVAILCENYAAASIINHYKQLCIKNQIEFFSDLNIPEKLLVPDNELCVVVGNLLENAYEACIRQTGLVKRISVLARMSGKNMLSITVKNTHDGLILHTADGKLLSAKRHTEGIGTASVASVAEKYNGYAKFEYTDKEFKASVFLNP